MTHDNVGGAYMRFDGMSITPSVNVSGDKLIFAVVDDLDGPGAKFGAISTFELQVMRPDGRTIRRYYWDVRRLREGLETVAIVGWRCTAP